MSQPLPVTGADRRAAAEFVFGVGKCDPAQRHRWAELGEDLPIVQAFARHRLASTPSTSAVPEGMREAEREVIAAAHALVMEPGGLRNNGHALCVVEKADNSDPHYQLCRAFERLAATPAPVPATREGWQKALERIARNNWKDQSRARFVARQALAVLARSEAEEAPRVDKMNMVQKLDTLKDDYDPVAPGVEIPAGMLRWDGGDSAPSDIGEATDVMHASGKIGLANKRSILWGRPTRRPTSGHFDCEFAGPEIETLWIIAYTPSAQPVASSREAVARDKLVELLAADLGDSYDCKRAWSAWGYGTMSEDDFSPVNDRVEEIADAILALTPDAAKSDAVARIVNAFLVEHHEAATTVPAATFFANRLDLFVAALATPTAPSDQA